MNDDSNLERPPWSRRAQEIGVIVWSSFLAACLASLLFFATVDPMLIAHDESPPFWLPSAMTGYALGFFFFWVVCAVASLLTAYLLETLPLETLPPNKNALETTKGTERGSRTP